MLFNIICAVALAIAMVTAVPTYADGTLVLDDDNVCQVEPVVVIDCPDVPEWDYHGDSAVIPDIKVTVCFQEREYTLITRPDDGTNEWDIYFKYQNGSFEPFATMHNAKCREQWVVSGVEIAVYVTCLEYTGWVTTGPITHEGEYLMERVDWDYVPA
jgi:hypothetical protein